MTPVGLIVVGQGADAERAGELATAARRGGADAVVALCLAPGLAAAGADRAFVAAGPPEARDLIATAALIDRVAAESEAAVVYLLATEAGLATGAAIASGRGRTFLGDVVALETRDREVIATSADEAPLLADLTAPADRLAVVAIRPGAFPAADGPPPEPLPAPEVERLGTGIRVLESRPAPPDSVAGARILFAIGRGVEEREGIARVEALAAAGGATVCATRPHVATGWLRRDRLVGRSGATIAPRLYVGFGVSGASQHLVGVQRSEVVAAVNTDPEAEIFDEVDLGIVADCDAVLAAVERRLGAKPADRPRREGNP
jgi:electron transfer flavoprotein alpha subunit